MSQKMLESGLVAIADALGASGELVTAIGAPDDAAWDGSAPSATLIAIAKKMSADLATIAENTAPV